MDGADPDQRQKRQLPKWMSRVAKNDKGCKSNDKTLDEEPATQACHPNSKHKLVKSDHNESSYLSPPVVIENTQKKKRRKQFLNNVDCGSHPGKVGSKKKKDIMDDVIRQKSKKGKSKFMGNEKTDVPSLFEDSDDLTVDDLMRIAEEYIEMDKEGELKVAASSKPENEAKGSLAASASDGKLCSLPETSLPCSLADENTQIRRTGDPSHGMLDLFLGPLLSKPLLKDNAMDLNLNLDLDITSELTEQCHGDLGREGPVPVKSSLKDKVAMFLS